MIWGEREGHICVKDVVSILIVPILYENISVNRNGLNDPTARDLVIFWAVFGQKVRQGNNFAEL